MILEDLAQLKVEKSPLKLTSFAGLPLLMDLARHIGLRERLNSIKGLWQRRKLYTTADYLLPLVISLIAGGESLSDIRLLRRDAGLADLVFARIPVAHSLSRFLRRFTHRSLHHLAELVTAIALMMVSGKKTLTIDIDSSLVEAEKEDAKKTYKGFLGYNPMLAWLAEPNVFLGGVFREGNASPQCHILSLLKYCVRRLPEVGALRLRSDSAGYRLDLMEYCERHGIEFAIGADLDAAVMETIEQIPEKKWRLMVRNDEAFPIAATIHTPGGSESRQKLPAYRLIVTKKLGQLDLFKPVIKYRAIITSLPESMKTEEVFDFYNGRGTAEKAIGELKHGFGLSKLPSGDLFANAAFFQVCLLAYNLVQLFKHAALPEEWKKFCIKNLRFRLIGQAGIVVRHAHRVVLKLSAQYPFFELFARARWAILAPRWAAGAL
jgi:hypothetical protein